jgi:hypothetical protein
VISEFLELFLDWKFCGLNPQLVHQRAASATHLLALAVRPAPGVISHRGRMGSKTGTRGFSPWLKGGSVAAELTEIGEMRRW